MKIIYLLFISLSLFASVITLQYTGEVSLFGKVGEATMQYTNDGKKYYIKVSGHGTGIIGDLTQHKQYIYESIGLVKDNILIPMKYISSERSQDLNKTKTYTFDYQNKKTIVTQHKTENEKKSQYNIFTFEYETTTRFVEESNTKELERVYHDDMVSVFFNKRNHLLSMKQGETKLIQAVGSDDTQDGVVVKFISKKKERYLFSVRVQKDYLTSGAEDITFLLDSNNILCETKMDGILLFGNATVKRDSNQSFMASGKN